MTDLVDQLRAAADDMDGELLPFARMYTQLADRVEAYEVAIRQLVVKKNRLRDALTQIRDMDVERSSEAWKRHSVKLKLIARAALEETE